MTEPELVIWILTRDDARLALTELSIGIHSPCGDKACNPCRVRELVEEFTEAQFKIHLPLLADLRGMKHMTDRFGDKRNTWETISLGFLYTRVSGLWNKWETDTQKHIEIIPHLINYLKMIYERAARDAEIKDVPPGKCKVPCDSCGKLFITDDPPIVGAWCPTCIGAEMENE